MADRMGASDCWLMFGLWATASDYRWTALIGFTLCAAYTFLPLFSPWKKQATVAGVARTDQKTKEQ